MHRVMKPLHRFLLGGVLLLASAWAGAQPPGAVAFTPAAERWAPFVSVTPFWLGKTGLDGGGDFGVYGASLRAGATAPFGRGNFAGAVLNYDYFDYDFSGNTVFGASPWGVVQRYGVSFPIVLRGGDGWSFGITPSVDWFRENGAKWGDALTYGGLVSATKSLAPDRRLGLGVAAFYRIEDTIVFPFVVVDWRIGERWRLINPLAAGPTGPAGLELDYRLTDAWSVGVGAAWRSQRFRLNESGPNPGGIGEERGVPLFVRVSRNFGPQSSLFLYAGAVVGGKVRLEDRDGNEIRDVSFDPAPLLGATLTYRF